MLDRLLQKKRYITVVGIVIATVPLVCLLLFVKFSFMNDLERTSIQQRQTYAVAATQILEERLEAELELGRSFATRNSLQQAVATGNRADIESHLKTMKDISRSMERIYVAAANGTMLAAYPVDEAIIGKDFSHRDWYQQTTRSWQPYVSDFFLRAVKPQRHIFIISIPITSPGGGNVGILVMEPKDDFIRTSLDEIKTGGSGAIYVVDKKGFLVFHQQFAVDRLIDYSKVPVVRKVTQGQHGAEMGFNPLTDRKEVAAYHPIGRSGWGVVTVQPLVEILAPLHRVEKGLYIFLGVIMLVAGYNAYKWSLMLLHSRRIAGELQVRSDQLADANESLQQQADELQAQAEELAMQAEELQSQNEELQVQGEELEMQAEELLQKNDELDHMQQQLAIANEYLELKVRERTAALYAEIDQHRRTDQELLESEGRYRSLVENINLGITMVDDKYRIVMTNAATGTIFDVSTQNLQQRTCFQALERRSTICPECPGQSAMALKTAVTVETEFVRPDGGQQSLRKIAFPVVDADGKVTGFIEVIEDITEQRRASEEKTLLEQQLRQSQKMEAIGQLAGGVAHDFNNLLTVIDGYGSMMLQDLSPENPMKPNLEHILAASDKAANLTRSLLAFSRKQVMNPFPADLNVIVGSVVKFLRRILGEDINLTTVTKVDPLPILADSVQIEQVLMNLATNARDAMPKGGMLTVETDLQQLDETFVKIHGYATAPGLYCTIMVTDSGCGMDEETRKKIFEPFFTTKEVGKGTGLGLSMAYGIIKQHNGYINVYSEPGKGTTFRIYLPATLAQAESERDVVVQPPTGGTETILLAEDDPTVRSLMEKILLDFGYQVILAEDGQDAVDKFAALRGEIDLVLMDVIMPKKNGKDAADEIRRLKPGIRVLFSSGYTADYIHSQVEFTDETELIMKPVKPLELIRKVGEVLGREPGDLDAATGPHVAPV